MAEDYRYSSSLGIDRPREGVLRIAFDRPERMNALTAQAHRELAEIWRVADADDTVSVILLCGKGDNFSAGGDFDLVEQMTADTAVRERVWREARDLVYNILHCTTPIVSAMQGAAAGGGLAAGLLADISVVARTARLLDGHVRLGVAAGDHAALLWPLLCGMAKAKYHLLLNAPLSGARAEEIGLVSLAVGEDELERTALDICERLAAGSPSAIRWTKYALNGWLRAAGPIFDASLAFEMMGFAGPDVVEGAASFREKRPPRFSRKSGV